jgi:hypothetical protein
VRKKTVRGIMLEVDRVEKVDRVDNGAKNEMSEK